ncbi:hypothetical protein DITRI_Ditri19aG0062900 [Diplodiscus trichospermus]
MAGSSKKTKGRQKIEMKKIENEDTSKPYSFGHPSIESVANQFLNQNHPPNNNTHPLVKAHRKIRCNQLSQQLNEVLNQLDAEKEKAKLLDQLNKGKEIRGWWKAPIDQCDDKELDELYSSFEKLCNSLYSEINKRSGVEATS